MGDVEISREDAALVLHDFKNALKDLKILLEREAAQFTQPPDAFGSGVDGQAEHAVAKKSGETFKQYVQDMIKAVTEHRDAAKARFDALFDTDFDSNVDISKIQSQIEIPSF